MARPRVFSSFLFLNITQFLGATNDNLFKMLVIFMTIGVLGEVQSPTVLALTGAVFVLPFLLFSIAAGSLADRFSKRNITVVTKVLEVIAMLLAVLAFYVNSVWGAFAVLFLMAFQSAIFGPSKYGIVPELVRRDQIARANGILTGLTVFATIVGTFLGSFLTDLTDRHYELVAWFCVILAVIGLIASLCIEKTPAIGIRRNIGVRMISGVIKVIKRTRQENYLFDAIIGSSYFFFVGSFVQLSLIPYAIQSLGLTDVHGGYLFLTAAGGIAIGAYIAGRLSGKQVELGISVLSGCGVSVFFFLLWIFQHNLIFVVIALFSLGIFGGMFLVPFDAYIQAASPNEERGENVAAGNFLSFLGIALAAFMVYFFGDIVKISAAAGFAWMGLATIFLAAGLAYRLSDTFVRILARTNFHTDKHIEVSGKELISHKHPSCYIAEATHWEVGLLTMTALQVRYMRFLVERPSHPLSKRDSILTHFAKVAFYDGEAPSPDSEAFHLGKRWIRRGYSVTILGGDSPALRAACRQMIGEATCDLLHAHLDETSSRTRGLVTPDMRVTLQKA